MEYRECKKHGKIEFKRCKTKTGYRYRCKQCMIDAVALRRKKTKIKAITYKGGKCISCGFSNNEYPSVFEFHHRKPEEKEFSISAHGLARAQKILKNELDKCDLYCANCHRIVHELNKI